MKKEERACMPLGSILAACPAAPNGPSQCFELAQRTNKGWGRRRGRGGMTRGSEDEGGGGRVEMVGGDEGGGGRLEVGGG